MRPSRRWVPAATVVTLVAAACSGRGASRPGAAACLLAAPPSVDHPSVVAAAEQGLSDAATADPTLVTDVTRLATTADAPAALAAFMQRPCGLIITVGAAMSDATGAAATAHPTQHFAQVDSGASAQVAKVETLQFDTAQAAFLAGYLAAGVSRSGIVATFGGQKLPTVTIDMDGFAEGVSAYDSRHGAAVKLLGWDEQSQAGSFTGDFVDGGRAATLARALIAQGADVLFPVDGDAGAAAAAVVAGSGGSARIVWDDTDGCVSAPQYCAVVLSSVEREVAVAVQTAVLASAHGRFASGDRVGTLANGGVALAPFHQLDAAVPAGLKAELAQVRQDIVDGRITITSPSQPGA